jgi:PhnB protein
MSNMVKFQPDGWHTVTPRIVVREPEALVGFLKHVFGAKGQFRGSQPAEVRIGDSVVMVSGEGQRDSIPAFLYVYVEDTDATYQRAIAADATSLEKPMDMPYGDRRAMVRDKWGNTWQIATHREDLSADEIRARMGGIVTDRSP